MKREDKEKVRKDTERLYWILILFCALYVGFQVLRAINIINI